MRCCKDVSPGRVPRSDTRRLMRVMSLAFCVVGVAIKMGATKADFDSCVAIRESRLRVKDRHYRSFLVAKTMDSVVFPARRPHLG